MLTAIKEFYKNGHNIIPEGIEFDCLNEYYLMADEVDSYFLNRFGTLAIDELLELSTVSATQHNLDNMVESAIRVNRVSLEKLWELTTVEYNPIDNYDKHSTITTTRDKVTETYNNGERTALNDKVTNTTDNQVSGFDSENLVNASKVTNTATGSGAAGKIENKTLSSTDSKVVSGTNADGKIEDVVSEYTRGNIGVKSAQSMISESLELYKNFSFYAELMQIIFNAIAVPIYVDEVI